MSLPNPSFGQEAELAAHRQALEALAKGVPLAEFLGQLCLLLESRLAAGHCSIFLLDEDGVHVRHGAAPSLPEAYTDLIDGLAIGPQAGSCCSAMHLKAAVVVVDIERDPLWEAYRAAALSFGLKACASVPILTAEQEVLGAFAIYRESAGPFPAADLNLLHSFTAVAALALEGHRRTRGLRDKETRHRALVTQSLDGIFYFDAQDLRVLESNPALQQLLGYSEEELLRLRVTDLVAHERESIQANIDLAQAQGSLLVGERHYRHRSGALIPVEVSATFLQFGGHPALSVLVRDLRARKAAEGALAWREAQLQAIMDQAGDSILVTDGQGRYLDANPKALEVTGYSREEIQTLTIPELLTPQELDSQPLRLDELRAGATLLVERQVRRKDGSTFTAELSARHLSDGRFLFVGRDITTRKRLEQETRLKARELQDAEALGRLGSWTLDLVTSEVRWSDQMYALLGLPPGRPFTAVEAAQFFDPKGEHGFREKYARLIQEGGETLHEQDIQCPDETVRTVRSIIRAERREGVTVAIRGVLQDITDAKAAEAALAESERTFRSLFDLSPAAMVLSRPSDGAILIANPAAFAMLQLEPAEIEGKRTVDFFADPEDRGRLLQALMPTGRTRDFELEMRVHGQQKFVLLAGAVLTYEGSPAILVALTDITERQRGEESLRQRQKLESLGVLAGGIAHDFNNLLTAVLGNLNLAQLHLPDETPAAPYLQAMEAVVQRAADLARQMLAYSGKGRFRQEFISLNALVGEMTHLLSVSISKRVQLRLELGDGLPALEGDPVQLQQVVMNLVTNASEAIGDCDGFIRIHTGLEILDSDTLKSLRIGQDQPPGTYLLLEVEDTGAGMPADTLERIFDPFFTTKAAGRGLGLSALLGILRGHHAGLGISTVPGRGTSFRLYFHPSQLPVETGLEPALAQPGTLQGRILVVDDEDAVRASLSSLLGHLGLTVLQASDGVEALACLSELDGRVDCVILDLTMPRMGGREALGHLRQRWPGLPVILTSGYASQEGELDLGGPGTFLGKPYRLAELKEALLKVLPGNPAEPS